MELSSSEVTGVLLEERVTANSMRVRKSLGAPYVKAVESCIRVIDPQAMVLTGTTENLETLVIFKIVAFILTQLKGNTWSYALYALYGRVTIRGPTRKWCGGFWSSGSSHD